MHEPESPSTFLRIHGTLANRNFIGLLVAQFLAAFNDQAIHAAAMFFAINTQALTERAAISLMPILFYAPWAIFCTVAGWLADRYSKRNALVFWKLAEIAITAVALLGFYLGRNGHPELGPWVVLSTVFLMGTHSAFFVPAKYGVMPEILPPHLLSKGNGLLESLSFLAVILGTVSGGVLSYLFLGNELVIGVILLGLAVVGALASFLIRKMQAANPTLPFPPYIYGPIVGNVKELFAVPALRLAAQGIAFFTFVVAFMRAAVYMLGESQNPRWDELKTSVVVGSVALGIGLGSPAAGWLSGRHVELRLVLLGAVGMILALVGAATFIDEVAILVSCIVAIGFFTGFYIVPLFTLLQHKAPKERKGEMIAASNAVNIVGAISASLLFFGVVFLAQKFGLSPEVTNRQAVVSGKLTDLELLHGRPVYFEVTPENGSRVEGGRKPRPQEARSFEQVVKHIFEGGRSRDILELHKDIALDRKDQDVDVSKYVIGEVTHYDLVPAGVPPTPDYDNHHLPRFLFFGAAAMTLAILVLLVRPVLRLRKSV
ncbi:MFS transporter [Limnoglobus roseus]|nr:MFS transporter [Limnoglobus roseus]